MSTIATDLGRCSALVPRDPGTYYLSRPVCKSKAKVVEDGRPYCTIHSPSYRAKKRSAQHEKWEKKREVLDARGALTAAAPDLLTALQAILATPAIRRMLEAVDSQTLEQADAAIRKALHDSR